MTNKILTTKDYCDAAKDLRCEVAALMAVAEVESSGGGYDDQGRIKIRFEGHKFREYTFGKYDKSHPHLSYPYKVQELKRHGYAEFSAAFALDEEAALKAASPGKFQPLGVNYREAGFKSVRDFWDFLRISERNQLLVFCKMVKFRQIDDELRRLDWAGFARNYNGSAYRDNDYDGKMKRAYNRYKKLKINCNQFTDLRDDEIILDIPTKLNAAGNHSQSAAISEPMSVINGADETMKEVVATDGAASSTNQTDENITNVNNSTKTVPDNFVPEDKTVHAPPPSGFMSKATAWVAGLGLGVPSLGALIESIKNYAADGSVNIKEVVAIAGTIAKFLFPYVVYLAIAFIVFWGIKELLKQVSLIVKIWINGRGDMNNVEVKPFVKYNYGDWMNAPVEAKPQPLSITAPPADRANPARWTR